MFQQLKLFIAVTFFFLILSTPKLTQANERDYQNGVVFAIQKIEISKATPRTQPIKNSSLDFVSLLPVFGLFALALVVMKNNHSDDLKEKRLNK